MMEDGDGDFAAMAPRGRRATLSEEIVADVRDALFERRLRPGDMLGTERTIAERYGVSRMAARDALRSLEAMGIVAIRMGAGGGARVASGNAYLCADVFAVQMELTGATAGEIVDAQRAIESLAAELAATRADAADIARLEQALARSEAVMDDAGLYTRACLDFHLAVARASANRVLYMQLVSLHHVSWPRRNTTLTPDVSKRVLAAHRDLLDLVRAGDAAGARAFMDTHVGMIRARRSGEEEAAVPAAVICC